MSKVWFLILNWLRRNVFNYKFIIFNISVFFVMLIVGFLPYILKPNVVRTGVIILFDNKNVNLEKSLEITFEENNKTFYIANKIESQKTSNTQLEKILDVSNLNVLVYFENTNNTSKLSYRLFHKKELSTNQANSLTKILSNTKYRLYSITKGLYEIEPEIINIDNMHRNREFSTGLTLIVGIPIVVTIMFISFIIGHDVVREKTNNYVENILIYITDKKHFFYKTLSGFFFSLIQGALFIIMFLVVYLITMYQPSVDSSIYLQLNKLMVNSNIIIVTIFGLISTLIGAATYISISTFLGALSKNLSQFYKYITIFLFTIFTSFFVALFFIPNPLLDKATQILQYIPILSTILSPLSLGAGIIYWYEALISLNISIIFLIVVVSVLLPRYKYLLDIDSNINFFKKIKLSFKKHKLSKRRQK